MNFPAKISGQKIDVIDGKIPLFLSKYSMKQADTRIDFFNDEVKILGKNLKIQFTASGHYAIPIGDSTFIEADLQDCEKLL